ncbi:hypothetical protein MIV034R [Invertebrate iridescent virus 3]|uniref:Putative zinc finger protein 034R n=1 Tax=Invertebrate iridescent virus 3 TaxID=345201 RepID=VF077_IIV3|nr:hypothetical protein MIV034R [Invertebrate iridescent virus 3]Q197C6.1 RecName: Full=Putative zinc finger protein 034R [Invertebrate iridescent virus 3]ABF82064.1 hypothetical protein MIV034R [Invertebrate iridescent virus 3]
MSVKVMTHDNMFVGMKEVDHYLAPSDYEDESESELFYESYYSDDIFEDNESDLWVDHEDDPWIEQLDDPVKTPKIIKPYPWMTSPTKSVDKAAQKEKKMPDWWTKPTTVTPTRNEQGILNYSLLLPPSTKKPTQPNKRRKNGGAKPPNSKPLGNPAKPNGVSQQQQGPKRDSTQQPTRLCKSVLKQAKCYFGAQCGYAHRYSDLKECSYGKNCKKIVLVRVNQDGTLHLANKPGAVCNFKHTNEAQQSYLARLPQSTASPKNPRKK